MALWVQSPNLEICETGSSLILEPSISASAKMTHLLRNPQAFSVENERFFELLWTVNLQSLLVFQGFETDDGGWGVPPCLSCGSTLSYSAQDVDERRVSRSSVADRTRCLNSSSR